MLLSLELYSQKKKKNVKTRVTAACSSRRVTCMGKSSRTGWHMGCSRAAARHGVQAHNFLSAIRKKKAHLIFLRSLQHQELPF